MFQWTILFILNLAASWIYTLVLLPGEVNHVLISVVFLWVYGIFLISLLLLFSVLFMNVYGVLIGLGGVSLLLTLLAMVPIVKTFNPYRLGGDNMSLLTGGLYVSDFYFALGVNIILIAVFLFTSIKVLNKKAL